MNIVHTQLHGQSQQKLIWSHFHYNAFLNHSIFISYLQMLSLFQPSTASKAYISFSDSNGNTVQWIFIVNSLGNISANIPLLFSRCGSWNTPALLFNHFQPRYTCYDITCGMDFVYCICWKATVLVDCRPCRHQILCTRSKWSITIAEQEKKKRIFFSFLKLSFWACDYCQTMPELLTRQICQEKLFSDTFFFFFFFFPFQRG